jgi:zinc protease
MCQKYFGVYGAGNLVPHHITPEPQQNGERRTVLKRPGTVGEVLVGYHVPGVGTPDHYVLDVISQILSGGRSARLYQALVDTGLASSASGSDPDMKDPYLFTMDANDRSGVSNDVVEKALEAELEKLKTTPVAQDELKRAFNEIDASFTFQNDTVSAQGEQIGQYAAIGDYHYLDNYLQRIHKVTPADIQRVAQTYFTIDNRTVATFEPQPLPAGAAPSSSRVVDNFGAVAPVTSPTQKATLAELDKKFNSLSPSLGRPIKPTTAVLPNGLTVIVEENHSNHTVAMTGYLRAGSIHDPIGKYGLASVTASLLQRGTTTKSAFQLYRQLESVGATVGIGASTDSAELSGGCLTKDFGLTLSTLADELRNPAFPAAELEKVRGETLSGLEQSKQDAGGTGDAGALASIAFAQSLFPVNHPYWSPSIDQSEAAIKSLTVDDLSTFYKTYYRPDTLVLVIVGDVKAADAVNEVKADFGDWAKPSTVPASETIPNVPLPATAPQPQTIEIPGTDQTSILWGFQGGVKRTDQDFYATTLMNFILGGSGLSARLGLTLRDRDGLCYTTYSSFEAASGAGPFSVFVGTNPQNARKAIHELKGVVQRMHDDGPTPQELSEAKAYLTGVYPIRLEDNAGVATQLMIAKLYNLGPDYIQKHASYYEKVTLDQVKEAARKHLHPDKAVLIIAGAPPAN